MSHKTVARVAVVENIHEPCLLPNPVHGVRDRGEGRAAWCKKEKWRKEGEEGTQSVREKAADICI